MFCSVSQVGIFRSFFMVTLLKYVLGRNTPEAVLLFSAHPIRRLMLTIYLINGDANFVHVSHEIFAHWFYYLLMVLNKNMYYCSGCQMVIFMSIFMPSTFIICHSAMKVYLFIYYSCAYSLYSYLIWICIKCMYTNVHTHRFT